MADNVVANPGAGGATFATDDIGGVQYPRSKITWGPDGTANDVDAGATALPVQGTVTSIIIGSITTSGTVTAIQEGIYVVSGTVTAIPSGIYTITGNATVAGTVIANAGSGTFTVGGSLTTIPTGTLTVTTSRVSVYGAVTAIPTGTYTVGGTVTAIQSGTFVVGGTVTAIQSGTYTVGGTVTAIQSGTYTIGGTVTAIQSGTFTVGGTVTAIPSGTYTVTTGIVTALNLGSQKTLKNSIFSITSTTTVVAFVSSKVIKVYGYELQSANDSMSIQLFNAVGGNAVTLNWTFNSREGVMASCSVPPDFLFKTLSQSVPINAVVSGTGTINGCIRYWDDDAS